MDPSSLPTDNIYKFLALSGLALSGFCTWLRWRLIEGVEKQVYTVRRDVLVMTSQVTWDDAESTRMLSLTSTLKKDVEDGRRKAADLKSRS